MAALPDVTAEIPPALVEDILAGRCVAFVGAGFSAAARLPGWKELLRGLAATPELDEALRSHLDHVLQQPKPSAASLDQAAQLVEDVMQRPAFIARLRELLQADPDSPRMRQRLAWLREIPFRVIVTTNFDPVLQGALPGPAAYRALLRPDRFRWWEEAFWGQSDGSEAIPGAPVVKLHGDLQGQDPEHHVVLTRRDYRRRLYGDEHYKTFLRGLLSTNTVLFMGFSFEDAYLNELRSQVLALFDYRPHQPPLAYALLNDVPPVVRRHFADHEGVQVLDFASRDDFAGFDQLLEAIWSRTAIRPRFGQLLERRRILWLDPAPDHNLAGRRFLNQVTSGLAVVDEVPDVPAAMARLQAEGAAYDLVLVHWGHDADHGGHRQPTALRLLERMRAEDVRCPVVVFSQGEHADERKRLVLALGAQDYCFRWQTLFQAIDRLLRPGRETG